MVRVRVWLLVLFCVALITLVFFEAPVASYSQSIAIPNDYEPHAYPFCSLRVFGNSTFPNHGLNETQFQEFNMCLNSQVYTVKVSGQASLTYRLLGVGTPPFPAQVLISGGNYSALVFFNGPKATEGYLFYSPSVIIYPKDTVEIVNASIQRTGYGDLHFVGALKNVGNSTITQLGFGLTGANVHNYLDFNYTFGGVTWLEPFGPECAAILRPGGTCTVDSYLGNATLPSQLHFTVTVEGYTGGFPSADGKLFFLSQDFSQPGPQAGVNRDWVNLFIGKVDQDRAGHPLVENSTLDSFAALRFRTASSDPQISDYGFSKDLASFFGQRASGLGATELLLFPGKGSPFEYTTVLQSSAPNHWSALMSSNYTQFGYYIGEAPYYSVSANCPTTEVPSAGVNITQYFESKGCTVAPLAETTWLVIILGK